MSAPDEMLLSISEVFDYEPEHHAHSFEGFTCEECGEMVAEPCGRVKGVNKVCIDCAAKD